LRSFVVVGIASVCIEAARCGGDNPWSLVGRKCSDYVRNCVSTCNPEHQLIKLQEPGWTAIATLDVALEIAIFLLPVWIVFDLFALRTKIVVCSAFALRLP
jgi:hypothetical protein